MMRDDVAGRLENVRERIQQAADRVGRRPEDVTVMAVTKTYPLRAIEEAVEAGVAVIGENRVQEAKEKLAGVERSFELHLVGHLQRNKAKSAVGLFDCVQSIDKLSTAQTLARHCRRIGSAMSVFVEYNTSKEASKSGVGGEAELFALVESILKEPELAFRGLMTIGPLTEDQNSIRASFRCLADLSRAIEQRFPSVSPIELSMGMSGDFEIAVEEGATMVRLGTVLFGQRGA